MRNEFKVLLLFLCVSDMSTIWNKMATDNIHGFENRWFAAVGSTAHTLSMFCWDCCLRVINIRISLRKFTVFSDQSQDSEPIISYTWYCTRHKVTLNCDCKDPCWRVLYKCILWHNVAIVVIRVSSFFTSVRKRKSRQKLSNYKNIQETFNHIQCLNACKSHHSSSM